MRSVAALSQLPTVFANFVSDQYMAVFAIALPYTNPFKYDNYIVSLAYHVISVWFLKCRLPFRRDFVKFIVSVSIQRKKKGQHIVEPLGSL
jgi:tuberous sclerosis protein 2